MSAAKSRYKKVARNATAKVPGKPVEVDIVDLLFDEGNPRLPEELTDRTQDKLLAHITSEYYPIEMARSISAHEYFPSEPLIVIKSDEKYVTVEGNRRLAALKLLQDPTLAVTLGLPDADEFPERSS